MSAVETIPIPGTKVPLVIADDRITPSACEKLYAYYARLPYQLIDVDLDPSADVKHFVHDFTREEWTGNPRIARLVEVTTSLVAERRLRHKGVQRVYANCNLFGDYQLAHDDGQVWTTLVYLNAKWHEDWGGETLFYAPNRSHAIAISPKPGRIVLFDGNVVHRGGVPSKFCLAPRVTLAVKFDR